MAAPSLWSAGRYESVGERIAHIAAQTVAVAAARRPLHDAHVVDLACGTGSAALAAAGDGAYVTAVDLTAELIELARAKAGGDSVDWVVADAADTGLPDGSFDAAISNMGIVFVDPQRQVAEISRLLKPEGVLAFSSWVREVANPLFDPIIAVLGAPPPASFRPDQWGDPAIIDARLAADYDTLDIEKRSFTWQFDSLAAAVAFVCRESPMHVDIFRRLDETTRQQLEAAFTETLRTHLNPDGSVSFDSGYVLVSARRR